MNRYTLIAALFLTLPLYGDGALHTIINKILLGGALSGSIGHYGTMEAAIKSGDVEQVRKNLSRMLPLSDKEYADLVFLSESELRTKKKGLTYCFFITAAGALLCAGNAWSLFSSLHEGVAFGKTGKYLTKAAGGVLGGYLTLTGGIVLHQFYHEYKKAEEIAEIIRSKIPSHESHTASAETNRR